MKTRDWEEQVSALIDGELDDLEVLALRQQVGDDPALARAIIESSQLQQLMRNLPVEQAPARLRRKLRRIPLEQGRATGISWLRPRWAFAMAAMPLLLALSLSWHGEWQRQQEIDQGRRDLAVALGYLQRAGDRINPRIQAAVSSGFSQPVAETTLRTLEQSTDITREYPL